MMSVMIHIWNHEKATHILGIYFVSQSLVLVANEVVCSCLQHRLINGDQCSDVSTINTHDHSLHF